MWGYKLVCIVPEMILTADFFSQHYSNTFLLMGCLGRCSVTFRQKCLKLRLRLDGPLITLYQSLPVEGNFLVGPESPIYLIVLEICGNKRHSFLKNWKSLFVFSSKNYTSQNINK